ncbi:MAG: DUF6443 domain-containing protein, partial [Prevotellaceae bacterium]|nr:DUF6443 domain-containing protein [Prevotellaceae bacterium]
MKRYFITVILTAMFCGNILSQNQVTFPHVIIDGIVNSTNIINDDCNGGNYVIRMQLYPSSYYVSGIELYDLFYLSLTSAGYYPRLMITNVEINPANNQVFATLYISKNTTSDINLIINGANGGYIIIHQLTCPPPDPITGDANNGNWIIKTTYTAPNAASYYRDITYYNGLGYPEQVIQIKGSPNMKNIVKPVYYDNMRRDNAKVYLPYISANNTAARESSPFTVQTAFYQNKFGADDGQYAYVENVFEASPLNKILQTYNVGKVYRTNDKKTVNNYGANSANEVLLMNVNQANGYVTITGRYAANTLYRNSTVNEDGATVYTYTDKLGQTILTRTKGDNNQNFDTYYVYDNFGRLVMVVPPEYSSNLGTNTTLIPGSTMVAHYCYTYKYDGRGNIIERQIPGKATEYIIYDKDDRPVLYQDGNMRENNQWIYSVYDNVGNLIDKTLVKTTLTRQQIQTKYFASNFHNDYVSLGQSSSIYAPFGGENFEEEYLIHSVRYYGKEYYLRNNLAAGIYLKVNTSVI